MWGVAYKIATKDEVVVKNHLDYREKGGYRLVTATFNPVESGYHPFPLDIYIGTNDNPYFLGPADYDEIAYQICKAEGPSGSNADYLFELAKAMKNIAPEAEDVHLYELERKVKQLISEGRCWMDEQPLNQQSITVHLETLGNFFFFLILYILRCWQ